MEYTVQYSIAGVGSDAGAIVDSIDDKANRLCGRLGQTVAKTIQGWGMVSQSMEMRLRTPSVLVAPVLQRR
nr:hypothetical protein CFP56_78807 [Quercus suber]